INFVMMSNLARKSSGVAGQISGQVQIHKIARRYSSNAVEINKQSKIITQPKSQGGAQAMCLKPEDMSKAQVGIASV
ncbi:6304_t:CDS:2, partial [Funneliformis mosseae]